MLTSCSSSEEKGHGWINHSLIKSGLHQPHINAFGGEDRFWIGPEAGQFALFFKPGDKFVFENWQTPSCIDTEEFEVLAQNEESVTLRKKCSIKNYGNHTFEIEIIRRISIDSKDDIGSMLPGIDLSKVATVAYLSENKIFNTSEVPWKRASGLLNIWILGKFIPSKSAWAIIPTKGGAKVNQDYFEADIESRLIQSEKCVLFKVDGSLKSKIGIAPQDDRNQLASIDFDRNLLTIVQYETDKESSFLNSEWKIQDHPFDGDVLNVYNDGPNPDGSILGPYYELETSSSSKELSQGEHISHIHKTFHFSGEFNSLNAISQALLNIDLNTIKAQINER